MIHTTDHMDVVEDDKVLHPLFLITKQLLLFKDS